MVLFNGQEYESFNEVLSLGDGMIKLVEDIDITGLSAQVSSVVTLDLNGHNLQAEGKEEDRLTIIEGGCVTLIDSVGTGKIFVTKPYKDGYKSSPIYINGGKFVMNSGYIYTVLEDAGNNGQYGVVLVGENPEVIINGGIIEAGWFAISGNGSKTHNSKITVNGGQLISTTDFAIYHPNTGILTVNGGNVSGAAGAIAINNCDIVLNGGLFNSFGSHMDDYEQYSSDGTYGLADAAINVNCKYGASDVDISGGTIVGKSPILVNTAQYEPEIEITGGSFIGESLDVVRQYLAEDVVISDDGTVQEQMPKNEDGKELNSILGAIGCSLEETTKAYIDTELVNRYLSGDQTALFELYKIARYSENKAMRAYAFDRIKAFVK